MSTACQSSYPRPSWVSNPASFRRLNPSDNPADEESVVGDPGRDDRPRAQPVARAGTAGTAARLATAKPLGSQVKAIFFGTASASSRVGV